MLNLECTIDDMLGRIQLLGLDNMYLDVNQVYFCKDSKIYLNLWKYLCFETHSVITLPEGISGVLLYDALNCLDSTKEYTIIFPESMEAVSEKVQDLEKGHLKFHVLDKYIFRNTTLDFRKCKNIHTIGPYSFERVRAKGIYFGDSVYYVMNSSFNKAQIDELRIPKVEDIDDYAFYNASVKELELGEGVVNVLDSGLAFDKAPKTLILRNLTSCMQTSLSGFDDYFLGYNINSYKSKVADILKTTLKDIKEIDEYSALDSLVNDLWRELRFLNEQGETWLALTGYLNDLLYTGKSLRTILRVIPLFFYDTSSRGGTFNIFLFDNCTSLAVIERRYAKIGEARIQSKAETQSKELSIYLDSTYEGVLRNNKFMYYNEIMGNG